MQLNIQTFAKWVQTAAAAAQASLSSLSYALGSVELAITEGGAAVAQWLQSLVVQVLSTTRLSTCTGTDVDTFIADFGLTRLPAVAAEGQVTFGKYTSGSNSIQIPVGTLVATANGGVQFQVVADTTQTAWNATLGAYVLPAGATSLQATVQAVIPGSSGNVSAGAIQMIQSNLPGIDTVTNASAYTDGIDVETDAAVKVRFQLFVQGLKYGTEAAVISAIANTQQGLTQTYTESYAYNGAAQPGYFYVVIDNGTGYPPSGVLTAVANAIQAVRPAGISFGVFAPSVESVTAAVTVTAAPGYTHATVASAVQTAITTFINSLTIGQSLYWSQLYAVVYAVPGVLEATGLQINGATSDIAASAQQIVKASTVTVI